MLAVDHTGYSMRLKYVIEATTIQKKNGEENTITFLYLLLFWAYAVQLELSSFQ